MEGALHDFEAVAVEEEKIRRSTAKLRIRVFESIVSIPRLRWDGVKRCIILAAEEMPTATIKFWAMVFPPGFVPYQNTLFRLSSAVGLALRRAEKQNVYIGV